MTRVDYETFPADTLIEDSVDEHLHSMTPGDVSNTAQVVEALNNPREPTRRLATMRFARLSTRPSPSSSPQNRSTLLRPPATPASSSEPPPISPWPCPTPPATGRPRCEKQISRSFVRGLASLGVNESRDAESRRCARPPFFRRQRFRYRAVSTAEISVYDLILIVDVFPLFSAQ